MKLFLFLATLFFLYSFHAQAMDDAKKKSDVPTISNLVFKKYMYHSALLIAVGVPAITYHTGSALGCLLSIRVAFKIIPWATSELQKVCALERSFWKNNKNPINSFLGS